MKVGTPLSDTPVTLAKENPFILYQSVNSYTILVASAKTSVDSSSALVIVLVHESHPPLNWKKEVCNLVATEPQFSSNVMPYFETSGMTYSP